MYVAEPKVKSIDSSYDAKPIIDPRVSVIKDAKIGGLKDLKTKGGFLVISESKEYKVQVNQFGVEVYAKLSAEEKGDINKNPNKYISESKAKLSDESTHRASVPVKGETIVYEVYDVDKQRERLKQAGMAQEGADISRSVPGRGSKDHIGAISSLVQNVGEVRGPTITTITVDSMSRTKSHK